MCDSLAFLPDVIILPHSHSTLPPFLPINTGIGALEMAVGGGTGFDKAMAVTVDVGDDIISVVVVTVGDIISVVVDAGGILFPTSLLRRLLSVLVIRGSVTCEGLSLAT